MWYENPTVAAVLGAVAGAILTGAISIFITFRGIKRQADLNKKARRIECFIRQAASLMSFSDAIKDRIKVTIDDQEVSSIHLFKVEIVNTGTEPVRQQPVYIRLGENAKIISHTVSTNPKIGFGPVDVKVGDVGIDLLIDLMNCGDRVWFSIMSQNSSEDTIEVFMKNAGVETAVHTPDNRTTLTNALTNHQTLSTAALMSSFPIIGWMFRGFALYALLQKLDKLSNDLKMISRDI